MKFVTQDYYEILSVSPGASNEEVKRAYRLVRQSFRPDSMAIHSLYSEEETEAISAKIDEAFRILSDPELARRYAKYQRTGRPGHKIPRDPDVFFDLVHDLEGPSPIEQLARQVGRLSEERRRDDRVIEEPVSLGSHRSVPPEPRFNRSPISRDLPPSTSSLREVRPVAAAPEPLESAPFSPALEVVSNTPPVQPLLAQPPSPPAVAQPAHVAALVLTAEPELSFDSLEELPEDAIAEPGETTWSAVVQAEAAPPPSAALPPVSAPRPITPPVRTPVVQQPVRPAARSIRPEPSAAVRPAAVVETVPSVPPVSPRVDPTSLALPGAQVAGSGQQTTLATVAAVAQQPFNARRWARDSVRTRAAGVLEVQPLGRDVLDAIEMDCGGMNGAFLKTARRELEVSVKDISGRTRISVMMLRYIEADDIDELPAKVYLKGYLTQIARLLRLPVTPFVEGYFRANGIP